MQLRKFLLHITLAIGLLCLLSFTFFYKILPSITNKDMVVSVPDVSGMTLKQAEKFLKARDLQIDVIDSSFDATHPPLTVLYQYPKPGSKVKIYRTIDLKLNARNPPEISFPDLTGTTLDFAQRQLKSCDLTLGGIRYKQDIAHNAILEARVNGQLINTGDRIKKGSAIDLVIGTRKVRFALPDFVGQPVDIAQTAIIGMDLIPELRSSELKTSDYVVIKQSPLPNDTVTIGDHITIWAGTPPQSR